MRYWIAVILCLHISVAAAQDLNQRPDQVWPPAWSKSKWTHDDTEFLKIRNQLERMKWQVDTPDLKEVARLVESRFPAVQKKIQSRRFKDIGSAEAYWVIALWAYFPAECQKYATWVTDLIRLVPAPPSYEYIRALTCVAVREDTHKGLGDLFERLISKWPEDPLVRWTYIEYAGRIDGYVPKIHDRLAKFSDELYRQFPLRSELLCQVGVQAYAEYWMCVRTQKAYDRLIFYFDVAISHAQIDVKTRERYKLLRKNYIGKGKKAGMKVPPG